MNFIVYAHRGASEYAPENTFSSFYLGCHMGANGIETDVRRTRDGVLVLFHDDTLGRVVGREGSIGDYSYKELSEMRVRNAKNGTEDVIVRFEDFLHYFGFRELNFAVELKEEGLEREVISLLDGYGMREKTVITSFCYDNLARVKALCPDFRVGYLADDFDAEKTAMMREIGGEQLCPKASRITESKVEHWHGLGFNVRAWGVYDAELMKAAYRCGVDGMTVNFPDLLVGYIGQGQE